MRNLLIGILDFRKRLLPGMQGLFSKLSHGQSPDCLFFACSDSRVVPNSFASTNPGELFLHRNVGNLVPPAHKSMMEAEEPEGKRAKPSESAGSPFYSTGAAIEFSFLALKVKDIVVCGHSHCGAMKATLTQSVTDVTPHLKHWLEYANKSRARLMDKNFSFQFFVGGQLQDMKVDIDSRLPEDDKLSQLNVLQQLENICTYPVVSQNAKNITLHGWWFDITTGDVYFFSPSKAKFVLISAEHAEELLKAYDISDNTGNSVAMPLWMQKI